jgi:hypothetical protein
VDIVVSDPERIIGAFDIQFIYDDCVPRLGYECNYLIPRDYSIGTALGNPDPASGEAIVDVSATNDTIRLIEVSLLGFYELVDLQTDADKNLLPSFRLATLEFLAPPIGFQWIPLLFGDIVLSDTEGNSIDVTVINGRIDIPEPSTLPLALGAIGAVWAIRRGRASPRSDRPCGTLIAAGSGDR